MKRPVFAFLFVVIAFSGCATSLSQSTIRIGVAGPHTGDLAPYGIPALRAVNLAAEQWNATGGLLGKSIEVVARDELCRSDRAIAAAHEFIAEDVVAVIGHACSMATAAALPVYEDADLPVISASASRDGLTRSPVFFRTTASDSSMIGTMADFLISIGSTRVAVVYVGGDYGESLHAAFLKEAAQRSDITVVATIENPGVNLPGLVKSILADKPDAVAYLGYQQDAVPFLATLRNAAPYMPIVGSESLDSAAFIRISQGWNGCIYVASRNPVADTGAAGDVLAAHREAFDEEAGPFFLNAYAAATCIFRAIEATGSIRSADIRAWLHSNTVSTPLGELSFDRYGEASASGLGWQMYSIENGEFVLLK